MDKFWESGFPQIITLVGLFVTAYLGPKAVAKVQGKNKVDEVKTEGDSTTETMYIQEMKTIISEYKEQVQGFKEQLAAVRSEFAEFKKAHEKR